MIYINFGLMAISALRFSAFRRNISALSFFTFSAYWFQYYGPDPNDSVFYHFVIIFANQIFFFKTYRNLPMKIAKNCWKMSQSFPEDLWSTFPALETHLKLTIVVDSVIEVMKRVVQWQSNYRMLRCCIFRPTFGCCALQSAAPKCWLK